MQETALALKFRGIAAELLEEWLDRGFLTPSPKPSELPLWISRRF